MRNEQALRGFTLVEMIIVVALFAVMLFALFDFYINFNTSYLYDEAVAETARSAGAVVAAVGEASFAADRVAASHTFSGVTYASGTTTLVLELPAIDAAGATISGAYDYVAFYANGANAYQTTDASASSVRRTGTKRLSDTVDSLSFAYDAAGVSEATKVTADITTALSVKGTPVSHHVTQTAALRNIAGS